MKEESSSMHTRQVHAGTIEDPFGSVTTPIYQTSTFAFKDVDDGAYKFKHKGEGYFYTRVSNPTIKDLEDAVASLEEGYGGIATSSGMSAVNLVFWTFLRPGDHIICGNAVYGPTHSVLSGFFKEYGIETGFVDATDLKAVEAAVRPHTKLIYIETPANPTMAITDIRGVAAIGKKYGALVAVDNTFSSPYLQRPLTLGADIVLHSMTKFINGHADVVSGMVVAKEKTVFGPMMAKKNLLGLNMDPHQAFLVRRGLKTLSIRLERAQENAIKIARFLEAHPKVKKVYYPGLEHFEQYALAKEQMSGPGALMSFEMKGGLNAGKALLNHLKIAALAVSLGGIETLIQHPASMTHSGLPRALRLASGITDGLVRLSVGIEGAEDLIADFEQALEKV